MSKIIVIHGIYDTVSETAYCLNGYFHKESREYIPICVKLRDYLHGKAWKFFERYNILSIPFTLGRDPDRYIEVIAITHTHFDAFNFEIGEDIVIGRIKRMRGDTKEIVYETEWVEKEVLLYTYIDKDTRHEIEVHKTIMRKRVKLDNASKPIIKIEIPFIPYNLSKRYRVKQKDGTYNWELVYPYIAMLED